MQAAIPSSEVSNSKSSMDKRAQCPVDIIRNAARRTNDSPLYFAPSRLHRCPTQSSTRHFPDKCYIHLQKKCCQTACCPHLPFHCRLHHTNDLFAFVTCVKNPKQLCENVVRETNSRPPVPHHAKVVHTSICTVAFAGSFLSSTFTYNMVYANASRQIIQLQLHRTLRPSPGWRQYKLTRRERVRC